MTPDCTAAHLTRPSDIRSYLQRPGEAELELRRIFPRGQAIVIFDIGACEAEDSIRYARAFPNAMVYAFEPLPANQSLAAENLRTFEARNVELVPLALSDRTGRASFHISSGRPPDLFSGEDWNYGNKSSSLLPPAGCSPMYGWLTFEETVEVDCETLESFCTRRALRRVDFIHMDVQGAEALVVEGAGELLRDVTAIWLEVAERELYRGQKLRWEIERMMLRRGFILAKRLQHGVEGDELFVNVRKPRVWPYLLGIHAQRLGARARFLLGGCWSRLRRLRSGRAT